MSTHQQAMIMETLLALRRTLKRSAYDSDSDSSIDQTTNRGNKLKKRARFVHQGRLTSSMGPAAYKEVAEHAGYQRAIIHRNPPLVDEDGYEIDSDDEEQVQEAMAAAMDDNPYSPVRLEQLLAPLTSVTDLPTHPTLSRPFTSNALTELIEQGLNLMHKENKALWKAKPLLTKLVGDNTWAPCGLMTAPDDRDALLFSDTVSFFNRPGDPAPAGPSVNGVPKAADDTAAAAAAEAQTTQGVDKAEQGETAADKTRDEEALPDAHAATNGEGERGGGPGAAEGAGDGDAAQSEPNQDGAATADTKTSGEDVDMAEAPGARAAPETQSTARPAAVAPVFPPPDLPPPGAAPGAPDELFIHPLFRLPAAAHPDRDLGLPEQEAEEVRRLLLLYVQKQEEICRGTKRLYEGLLRADRLRKTVLGWAKAEAHCGPNRDMSDGEDWYDKEEWGLTEDLKKGEDEVEEDTSQSQKKTRNRK